MYNTWPRSQNGLGVQWTDALFYFDLKKVFFLEDSQNDDSQEEDEKCEDTGCGRLWNGHGQCVNMTKMTYLQAWTDSSMPDEKKNAMGPPKKLQGL